MLIFCVGVENDGWIIVEVFYVVCFFVVWGLCKSVCKVVVLVVDLFFYIFWEFFVLSVDGLIYDVVWVDEEDLVWLLLSDGED